MRRRWTKSKQRGRVPPHQSELNEAARPRRQTRQFSWRLKHKSLLGPPSVITNPPRSEIIVPAKGNFSQTRAGHNRAVWQAGGMRKQRQRECHCRVALFGSRNRQQVHGERHRVGGSVRWKSMGWPQCGQSGEAWTSLGGSGSLSCRGLDVSRCCCRANKRGRTEAPKKPK